MLPKQMMRDPNVGTGLPQDRSAFTNARNHVIVEMPRGTDYGVSEQAYAEIKRNPGDTVTFVDRQGATVAVRTAAQVVQIPISQTMRVRGRTLHMIPKGLV